MFQSFWIGAIKVEPQRGSTIYIVSTLSKHIENNNEDKPSNLIFELGTVTANTDEGAKLLVID